MKETAVTQRYSRALFQAIQDKGLPLGELQAQLQKAAQIVRTDSALSSVLTHALLPFEEKQAALRQALDRAHAGVSPLILNFFELLIKRKRLGLLSLMLSDFDKAVDEARGIIRASAKSASLLDDESRKALERRLSEVFGKETIVEASVDQSLLAGMVVRAGGLVFDNSLKSQLKNLKENLEQLNH